ncbi:MAG: hypothetical protein OXG85_06030 [Chloroflexi bacterium]|nr:hypothetical protein [Chloroflexota bacterium]
MELARKLALAGVVLLSLLPMSLFAFLGLHTRPMSDDYCYIHTSAEMPLLEFVLYWRDRWDGSYSDYALRDMLGPLGFEVAALFPAILIGGWFLVTAMLVARGLQLLNIIERQRRAIAIALSALLVAAICSGLYGKNALYWYAASVRYSVSAVTLTLFMLVLLRVDAQASSRRHLALPALAAAALCFVGAGFAETVAIAQFVCLSWLMGALWLTRSRSGGNRLAVAGAGWLATIAGMLVIVTAPGVAHRVAWERARSPELLRRAPEQLLAQTVQTWFDRVSDPELLASFALLLAAGMFLALSLVKRAAPDSGDSVRLQRNPLRFGLLAQLLLLPMIWQHQSADASLLGRFSAAYFLVILGNAALIASLALCLWRRERINGLLRERGILAPAAALGIILLLFALTQFRSVHWRAQAYLWISCYSLLLALAWLLLAQLPAAKVRGFTIGMGCLILANWTAIAAVAFAGHYFTPTDTARTFTFAAHLTLWQGLAWGLFLGYAIASGHLAASARVRWWLQGVVLVVVLALSARIVADQVALLPKFQQYASEFDARHASIIEQRAAGIRQIAVAPLSFNLERYLKVARLQSNDCPLLFYDIDDIEVQAP